MFSIKNLFKKKLNLTDLQICVDKGYLTEDEKERLLLTRAQERMNAYLDKQKKHK